MLDFGFKRSGRVLPAADRLFYTRTTNGTSGNAGKYMAPAGDADCFAAAPELYTDVNTPLALTGAELVALQGHEWSWQFSTSKGLSIYNITATTETINKARRYHRLDLILLSDMVMYSQPFVDAVGANTRTMYGLQYLHLAGATDFTNVSIVGTETATSQPSGTATITVAAGKLTIGTGDLWSFALSNGSTYEFGTILTATTGVVFDTSGNGRHLLFSVADTSVVCLSGREKGSDYLDTGGWTLSDGTSQYLSAVSFGLIPVGVIIPAGCAFVVGG